MGTYLSLKSKMRGHRERAGTNKKKQVLGTKSHKTGKKRMKASGMHT